MTEKKWVLHNGMPKPVECERCESNEHPDLDYWVWRDENRVLHCTPQPLDTELEAVEAGIEDAELTLTILTDRRKELEEEVSP